MQKTHALTAVAYIAIIIGIGCCVMLAVRAAASTGIAAKALVPLIITTALTQIVACGVVGGVFGALRVTIGGFVGVLVSRAVMGFILSAGSDMNPARAFVRDAMLNTIAIGALFVMVLLSHIVTALIKRTVQGPPSKHPHCERCGYNQTGNESGVCPECGTAISKIGGAVRET